MYLPMQVNRSKGMLLKKFHYLPTYSVVPVTQVGWNKGVGWEKMQKLIKELN